MKKYFFVFLLSFLCVRAYAQEDLVSLDKIVVTPYRYDEELARTAGTVTIITPSAIKDSSAGSVADVLRSIPGVVVRDIYGNGAKATVDIAGFGEQSALNVLVLVDGRRVNDADMSGVDWGQIPLNQVERIEIIRGGSAGVLYGDNASSGVINIITKKGAGKPKVTVQTEYGSYDMNKQALSLDGRFDNRLSYWLNAGRQSINGYRGNTFNKANNFASKLEYDITDAVSTHFNSGFQASTYGLPSGLFQHHIDANGRRWARYGEDHANNKDYYFVTGSSITSGGLGRFDVDFSYRRKDTDSYFLTSGNPTRKNKIETMGVTPKYTLGSTIFNHNNKLIAGIDCYRVFYRSNQYFFPSDSNLKDITGIQKTSVGGYAQDELSVLKQLAVVGGYRYEVARYAFVYHDFDTVNFGHPYSDQDKRARPKMQAFNTGLVYNYKDDSSAFLNVGKSFRFPEVDEFTFQDINFQQQLNTDLRPQSAIDYRIGLRHKFTDTFGIDLSWFRMNVKHELYFNPNGGPFGFGQNENYDTTVHQGFESCLQAKLNKWTKFFGNYTFSNAFFCKGPYNKNEIPMVPRHKGELGLSFFLPGSITFNITGNYVGKRRFINDQANAVSALNGYMVADTSLSWRYKDFTAMVGINNLLDKQYSEFGVYGTDSSNGFILDKCYFPSPGRNFSLKFDYAF